jgi:hypothetical protein
MVLLNLRATAREDTGTSPAELMFGQTLSLPADLVEPVANAKPASQAEVAAIRETIQAAQAPVTDYRDAVVRVPKTLLDADFVYIRNDAPKSKLAPLYHGPYRVISRPLPQSWVIEVNGVKDTISVSRLRPATTAANQVTLPDLSKPLQNLLAFMEEICPSGRQAKVLKPALTTRVGQCSTDQTKKSIRFGPVNAIREFCGLQHRDFLLPFPVPSEL